MGKIIKFPHGPRAEVRARVERMNRLHFDVRKAALVKLAICLMVMILCAVFF